MFPNTLNGKYTTREKNSFHKPNNGEHLNQAPSMPSYALYGPKEKKPFLSEWLPLQSICITYFEAISTNSSYETILSFNLTVFLKNSVNFDSANMS